MLGQRCSVLIVRQLSLADRTQILAQDHCLYLPCELADARVCNIVYQVSPNPLQKRADKRLQPLHKYIFKLSSAVSSIRILTRSQKLI